MLAVDLFFALPDGADTLMVVSTDTDTRQNDHPIAPDDSLFIDFVVDRSGDTSVTFDLSIRIDGTDVVGLKKLELGPRAFYVFDDVDLGQLSGGEHIVEIELFNTVPADDIANNILSTTVVVESGEPDLIPFQLPGWDDIIVVSSVEENSGADGLIILDSETVFIDFGFRNDGTDSATQGFETTLYLDDSSVPFLAATINGDLPAGASESFTDITLSGLSVGQHTLRLEIDATDVVSPRGNVLESNESNNSYSRSFYVLGSAKISGTVFSDTDGNGVKDESESGIAHAKTFLDVNNNNRHDLLVRRFDGLGVPLLLGDSESTTYSRVVAGNLGMLIDVDVLLNIQHDDLSQLSVFLGSPSGDSVLLVSGVNGSGFSDTVFDDDAPTAISDGLAPFSGAFRPVGLLDQLSGIDANGTWTLTVVDQSTGASGTVDNWSITITTQETSVVTGPDGSYTFEHLASGVYRVVQEDVTGFDVTSPADVDFVPPSTLPGLDIQFRLDPALLPNPDLELALEQAADIVEQLFFDPITVVIDVKFGAADSLAFTQPELFLRSYPELRELLQGDAAADEEILFDLPPSEISFTIPVFPEPFSLGDFTATRANLLALGLSPSLLTVGEDSEFDPSVKRDAQIVYNIESIGDFDFDRSDGIRSDQNDFVGTTVHEIFHALGFVSEVDNVELIRSEPIDPQTGEPRSHTLHPTPLDLFRLAAGDGASDFTGSDRILHPDVASFVFDGGVVDATTISGVAAIGEVPMSGGATHQAGHLRDDDLTGVRLGIMDPTTEGGVYETVTSVDARIMGLIGWDLPASLLGAHTIVLKQGDTRAEVDFGNSSRVGGDLDNDGTVSFADFLVLSTNFGKTDAVWEDGDFDADATVGFADFLILSANFG